MTEQEAKLVLARMTAAWPQTDVPAATIRLYLIRLAPWRFDWTMEAVGGLEESSSRFPPISGLIEAYNAVRRRREPALPPGALGPLTEKDRERGLEGVARARRALHHEEQEEGAA